MLAFIPHTLRRLGSCDTTTCSSLVRWQSSSSMSVPRSTALRGAGRECVSPDQSESRMVRWGRYSLFESSHGVLQVLTGSCTHTHTHRFCQKLLFHEKSRPTTKFWSHSPSFLSLYKSAFPCLLSMMFHPSHFSDIPLYGFIWKTTRWESKILLERFSNWSCFHHQAFWFCTILRMMETQLIEPCSPDHFSPASSAGFCNRDKRLGVWREKAHHHHRITSLFLPSVTSQSALISIPAH